MLNGNISDKLIIAANKKVKEKKYWLDKLAGEPVRSVFPPDFSKDKKEAGTAAAAFDGETAEGLLKLSRGSDPRLHM
ncbi:MAG: hypothetical protein GY771_03395, partial [bacterium]|nr:hypothetical protein [bacterium]